MVARCPEKRLPCAEEEEEERRVLHPRPGRRRNEKLPNARCFNRRVAPAGLILAEFQPKRSHGDPCRD